MAKRRGYSRGQILAMQLGPTSAQVKLNATPQQWNRLKRSAHGRGLSMEDFFNRTPQALAPRSRKQIEAQANKTISSAYAPVKQELSDRERKINAIDDKRRRDDEYYRQWLTSQSSQLASDAAKANEVLTNAITGIDANARTAFGQATGAAQANVAATPGVRSDLSTSTALQNVTAAAGRADLSRLGQSKNLLESSHISGMMEASTRANTLALVASNEAKRSAATWESLMNVADDRQKVVLQEAADKNKEVARLLDQEITKANSNRDYSALMGKLDVQRADITQKGATARSKARTEAAKLKETQRWHTLQNDAKLAAQRATGSTKRADFIAKYGKTPEQFQKMNENQRITWMKRWNKSGGGSKDSGGSGGVTKGQRLKNRQTANRFISSVNTLKSKVKLGPSSSPGRNDGQMTNERSLLRQGYDAEQIQAAYELKIGTMSTQTRNYLKRILKGYGIHKFPPEWVT